MIEIQMKELQRCIKFITAINCQFKIITPEGEEFGELVVEQKKKRTVDRSSPRYPFGEIARWYKPFINLDLKVGEVMTVPFGDFDKKSVQSGVISFLVKSWGKKTFTSVTTETQIEILRTA